MLGDRAALPTLHNALEDWEPRVRRDVIDALAKLPDPGSLDPLLTAFHRADEDNDNRAAILRALGALGLPKAVAVLREELAHPSRDDLRPQAFRALWRSRHVLPRARLCDEVARAIASDNQTLVYDAVLRAGELRSPRLVKPLLAQIEHPREDIRNKAVFALGVTRDRRATAPLLALLPKIREARMRNNIAFAVERLDPPAFYAEVGRRMAHKQAIIRLNATFVAGDIRRIEALPLLEQALADPSDQVKTEALVGLGKVPGSPLVAPLIGRALGDPSETVRREAIVALGKLPQGPLVPALLERALRDPSESVQRDAILALVDRGGPSSIPALESFFGDRRASLRDEAIHAVHHLSGDKRGDLIHDRLFRLGDPSQRHRAAIALGKTGDVRVRDYLVNCLETRSCQVGEVDAYLRSDRDPAIGNRLLRAWAKDRNDLAPIVAALKPVGFATLASADFDVALALQDYRALRSTIDLMLDLRGESDRARIASVRAVPDRGTQLHTELALARLGDRSADAELLRLLDHQPAEWLPHLARKIRAIPGSDARARWSPELARRQSGPEFPIALAAAAVLLEWEPEAALPRMLGGLGSQKVLEREPAERYLWHRSPATEALLQRALATEEDAHVGDELRKLLDVPDGGE